ncbi:HD domain-containing protein [Photobacterium damselae]|uniref:HD domain-containing protein n=1 Tax=Photobacterium damselae TaxID=38293 RepID=UPI000E000FD5|nr:HD domain-containing protein [Photobacterium damselae]SUB90175.1 putative hydrolase [Photobacterium damselae]
MDCLAFEVDLVEYLKSEMSQDMAHDVDHILRVVKSAKMLCQQEGANIAIVLPVAYLHDCFSYPKDHPDRHLSSYKAADKAVEFLNSIGYPSEYFEAIHHAIVAHSFSAQVTPTTLEAQIVQDADRLDALGAIGVTRCILVSAKLKRPLYQLDDPFCQQRSPDDSQYTLDHFYTKLLKLTDTMNTRSAQEEAGRRTEFMYAYLKQLELEL